MIEAKLLGPYVVAREMLPALRDGGSITLFSGVLARRPGSAATGLAATNAAVEGLTRALAKELGPRLRANCISPGVTRTDAHAGMDGARREAMFEAAATGVPLRRVAEARDIAHAVVFAITSSNPTGCVLDVDGGHMIA